MILPNFPFINKTNFDDYNILNLIFLLISMHTLDMLEPDVYSICSRWFVLLHGPFVEAVYQFQAYPSTLTGCLQVREHKKSLRS